MFVLRPGNLNGIHKYKYLSEAVWYLFLTFLKPWFTVCEAEKGKIREDHDKFKYILKMS